MTTGLKASPKSIRDRDDHVNSTDRAVESRHGAAGPHLTRIEVAQLQPSQRRHSAESNVHLTLGEGMFQSKL